MARALHSAGFTPEPLDFVHGFLVERWCENARALQDNEKPIDKIGLYLGARTRLFPARNASGASIGELLEMCRRNISLAFGDEACQPLDRFDARALQTRVRRLCTDNKLDREEWLRLPGGRLLKTDALDHHQSHDLIGCQDLAWDIAGTAIEFDLDANDLRRLIAASACAVDPDLLGFCRIAYPSFRLGRALIAGEETEAARYRTALQSLLHQHVCPETRQESSVD
jgi:hypothetical protein